MQKSLLKEIILEQQKDIQKKDQGIIRDNLKDLKKYFKLPHAIVISGIRRVGKSTLLLQIMKQYYFGKCYYFNFEDERLLDFQISDFSLLYETLNELFGEKKVFFFDEIQNVKGWENFVRRMQEKEYKFFLTGSNATLLSKELGTKLTGRYIANELFPFSFGEFLKFQGYNLKSNIFHYTLERAKIKKFFNRYFKVGGMPEYLKYKETEVLKKVYENILYRDITARYEIKEVKALRELTLYYLSNLATLFSYNKLKNILKLGSVNTVKSYTQYLENSYLISTLNLYSYSLKQQFIASKKVYCIDNGIANSISFKFSQNRGSYLENLVSIELKRKGYDVYYYRTKNNLEIDFIIRKGSKIRQIIQVTQDLNNPDTREREIKSLVRAMQELNLNHGLILTEDEKETIHTKGKTINILPVYQWLLESK